VRDRSIPTQSDANTVQSRGCPMTSKNRRIIPEKLQHACIDLLSPLIKIFAKWGLTPNAFTIGGMVITAMAAAAFVLGQIRWGGILLLVGGLCDVIDGNLARATDKASPFGALFDASVDRYAEFFLFFGIMAHYVQTGKFWTGVVAFFALCGSMMVSYCRARAESLGFDCRTGIMQRPERIVILGAGALFHPAALVVALWLVAILANYTALQRIRHAYSQGSAKSKYTAKKIKHFDKN